MRCEMYFHPIQHVASGTRRLNLSTAPMEVHAATFRDFMTGSARRVMAWALSCLMLDLLWKGNLHSWIPAGAHWCRSARPTCTMGLKARVGVRRGPWLVSHGFGFEMLGAS